MKSVASDAYIRQSPAVTLTLNRFDVGIERYDLTLGVSY